MQPVPIVVDLDGTLVRTDLLYESANRFVTRHPFRLFRLAGWLLQGRSLFKAQLARAVEIDPALLPYNDDLLAWLHEQKGQGRALLLATASDERLAGQVAEHLGLFDAVLASNEAVNLKAEHKRDALVARFGEQGFDYVGDAFADLPVWRAAGQAHVVSSSRRLIDRVKALGNAGRVFTRRRPSFAFSLLRAMRPHQWVKNLLLFVPLFTAQLYGDPLSVLHSVLAFLAFGLTASSVYLLNDMVDLADDRHHSRKRQRPFACGDISLLQGWLAWPLLLLTAIVLAVALLPAGFLAVLSVYFALTLAYSLVLKQKAPVDVLLLAALYTLRIVAGAAALPVPVSFWLLAFSMFLFLSLAFIKRYSELIASADAGESGMLRGRGYLTSDKDIISSMGTGAGYLAVLVLALYIQDSHTTAMYRSPEFIWLACPLLLYWISRVWLIAHRGRMHDDPIVFALKDRMSWLIAICMLIVFGLATLVG